MMAAQMIAHVITEIAKHLKKSISSVLFSLNDLVPLDQFDVETDLSKSIDDPDEEEEDVVVDSAIMGSLAPQIDEVGSQTLILRL